MCYYILEYVPLLVNLVEIFALMILAANFLLLVDVRQEVADVLELSSFGCHTGTSRLGTQPLVPGIANVERPRGGASLERLLGRRLGRLGFSLRRCNRHLGLCTVAGRTDECLRRGE